MKLCMVRLSTVVPWEILHVLAVEDCFQNTSIVSGLIQIDCLSKLLPEGLADFKTAFLLLVGTSTSHIATRHALMLARVSPLSPAWLACCIHSQLVRYLLTVPSVLTRVFSLTHNMYVVCVAHVSRNRNLFLLL